MKNLKLLLLLMLTLHGVNSIANDGVYYTSGNQLIPIVETRISVKKEILNIKRVGRDFLVCVYYEMYNPDEARDLEVGFEANSPGGEREGSLPLNGRHPYIYEFTVNMNEVNQDYKVAIVENDKYYKDGKYIAAEWPKKDNGNADDEIFDYNYVYHFKAHFKKGLNKIIHTYRFASAGSVENAYDLDYVLTAAMRWGNKQIDDFTLNIDVGDFQTLYIDKTFFKSFSDWVLIGKGKSMDKDSSNDYHRNHSAFYIQKGTLYFHKTNFKTTSELSLYALWPHAENNWENIDTFNVKIHQLVFPVINQPVYAKDETSLKILKNLPYARRGYVFKTKELQDYFSKMSWYSPDPAYIATLSELTDEEQKWLKELKI